MESCRVGAVHAVAAERVFGDQPLQTKLWMSRSKPLSTCPHTLLGVEKKRPTVHTAAFSFLGCCFSSAFPPQYDVPVVAPCTLV